MPYPNEHAARIKQPGLFKDNSFFRRNIESGVDVIVAELKSTGKTTAQSYRFDASKFTPKQAKEWLRKRNITWIKFEPSKT